MINHSVKSSSLRRHSVTARKKLFVTVSFLAALLVALLIIIVSPLVRIRFRVLPIDEIGPLAFHPNHYLWGTKPTSRTRDYWIAKPGTFVCNQLVLEKSISHLRFRQSWFFWFVFRFTELIGGQRFSIPLLKERKWFNPRNHRNCLALTNAEMQELKEWAATASLDLNKPFATFVIRDELYKQNYRVTKNFRDVKENYRNHDSDYFGDAARAIVSAGGTVVRMGVLTKKPLLPGVAGVMDYSHSGLRSELADLGIMAHARLCVSTATGFDAVSDAFGVRKCVIGLFPYFSMANL